MNLSRLGGVGLAVLILTAWMGACTSTDEACGINGLKNGTCQVGPTCPTGSLYLSIVDPDDMCPESNGSGGLSYICCVPNPDAATLGDASQTPDATSGGPDGTVHTDATQPAEGGMDSTGPSTDTGVDTNPPPTPDTGTPDTGSPDTGTPDTGTPDTGSDTGPACGAGTACTTAATCPATTTACVTNTCTTGCCGTTNAAAGTTCSDSNGAVCDGAGSCVACNAASDCTAASCSGLTFTPGQTCVAHACVSGTPQTCVGACSATSGCVGCNTAADCAAASCNGNTFTPASTCVANACVPGVAQTCPAGCTTSGCVAPEADGSACTANAQCISGICDVAGAGNCCTATCTGGACGATSCDTTGACVYPGNTVAPASLQTTGDCQQIVCNGSGGATSVDDLTDLPTPTTVCETNPACSGSPAAPSFTPAPTGTSCTADNNPPNTVCGDTTNPAIAGTCVQCNVSSDCPGTLPVCAANVCVL